MTDGRQTNPTRAKAGKRGVAAGYAGGRDEPGGPHQARGVWPLLKIDPLASFLPRSDRDCPRPLGSRGPFPTMRPIEMARFGEPRRAAPPAVSRPPTRIAIRYRP